MVRADLLERLDQLDRIAYNGEAWRHVAPGRNPSSGEGARVLGGRWNPPDSFPALYLGLTYNVVVSEFYRAAARQALAPASLLPRVVYQYEVEVASLVDLRSDEACATLGVTAPALLADNLELTQAIGEAGHYLGLEGLLAPSAAGPDAALALFTDRFGAQTRITVVGERWWTELPVSE